MLRTLLLISIAFTLSSCASKYAPMENIFSSNQTGYFAIPVDSSTYRVVFSGNRSLELADRYAFYRAAELTLEKGFDYFVVLQTGADEKQRDAWNTVRMFKGAPPEGDLATFDAREVVRDMAPFIQRDDEGANK
jgi:hypothetical protein